MYNYKQSNGKRLQVVCYINRIGLELLQKRNTETY